MPRIDFRDVPDPSDFTPVPEGTYLCQLADIEVTETRAHDEMWRMRFTIESGPYEGRSFFDNLVFSPAAWPRAKLFCSALGIDTSADVNLEPDLVQGRRCRVTVQVEDYVDREGGTRRRNAVAYRGYVPLTASVVATAERAAGPTEEDGDDDLPF